MSYDINTLSDLVDAILSRVSALDGLKLQSPAQGAVQTLSKRISGDETALRQYVLLIQSQLDGLNSSIQTIQTDLANIISGGTVTIPITNIQVDSVDVTPIAGVINILSGSNVTLTPSANDITIASTGGGGGNINNLAFEVPTGTINGSNGTFILVNTPIALMYFLNGQLLTAGTDYSLSGSTVTYIGAVPRVGDNQFALYTF